MTVRPDSAGFGASQRQQKQQKQQGGGSSCGGSGASHFQFDVPLCWSTSSATAEECVYHICMDTSIHQPVAIFVNDADVATMAAMLKHLLPDTPCIGMCVKTKRQQVQKLLRKNLGAKKPAVLVLATESALFVSQSCLPPGCSCATVVHVTAPASHEEWKRRCSLLVPDMNQISSTNIRDTGTQIRVHSTRKGVVGSSNSGSNSNSNSSPYQYKRAWVSVIQARVAVALKLCAAVAEASRLWRPSSSSSDDFSSDDPWGGPGGFEEAGAVGAGAGERSAQDERRRGLGGKMSALEARLKVLMATELPGRTSSPSSPLSPPSSFSASYFSIADAQPGHLPNLPKPGAPESTKSLRAKMLVLKMLHEPSEVERAKQAEQGRSLAVTQWLDEASGRELGLPWDTVRFGAAADQVSLQVRDAVEAFRLYIVKRAGGRAGAVSGRRDAEANLASKRLRARLLAEARVVAFGWRPSPYGDQSWGGIYGKACSHNEVALFFSRPFAPMEVLNTHCCSRASPAPGNEGHDGCLEFLQAQSAFFGRAQTIWDSTMFHFIDPKGAVESLPKARLLHCLDEAALRDTVVRLRLLTVECGGAVSPVVLLERIRSERGGKRVK